MYCTRLNSSFFITSGILCDFQFGFRLNQSITLALIVAADNIYYNLDRKDHVLGIYLNLQKAFDTFSHEILIWKFINYGLRGSVESVHSWFSSYLNIRKQFTSVNGAYSSHAKITCGVPHRSVLRPLLFLLYINDI